MPPATVAMPVPSRQNGGGVVVATVVEHDRVLNEMVPVTIRICF